MMSKNPFMPITTVFHSNTKVGKNNPNTNIKVHNNHIKKKKPLSSLFTHTKGINKPTKIKIEGITINRLNLEKPKNIKLQEFINPVKLIIAILYIIFKSNIKFLFAIRFFSFLICRFYSLISYFY